MIRTFSRDHWDKHAVWNRLFVLTNPFTCKQKISKCWWFFL